MLGVLLAPLNAFLKCIILIKMSSALRKAAHLVKCLEKELSGAALGENTENTALVALPWGASVFYISIL